AAPSNLAVRLATAGVGGPVILLLLYLGPWWGWGALVVVATGIGAAEFFAMFSSLASDDPAHAPPADHVSTAFGVALTQAVLFLLLRFGAEPKVLLTLILVLPIVAVLFVLVRLGDIKTAATRVAAFAFGPLYLGGGLGASVLVCRDAGSDGPSFVVLALMLS